MASQELVKSKILEDKHSKEVVFMADGVQESILFIFSTKLDLHV